MFIVDNFTCCSDQQMWQIQSSMVVSHDVRWKQSLKLYQEHHNFIFLTSPPLLFPSSPPPLIQVHQPVISVRLLTSKGQESFRLSLSHFRPPAKLLFICCHVPQQVAFQQSADSFGRLSNYASAPLHSVLDHAGFHGCMTCHCHIRKTKRFVPF